MTTTLPAVSAEKANDVAVLLGAKEAPAPTQSRLPKLKVNSMRKDEQGRKIPEGQFTLQGDGIEPVYAEKVTIRVLSQLFQWLHYDPEENKVANKTLMIPNFRHEARDMKGGLRCGKPTSRVLREASKEEQKKYSDITCFRQLRVIVSYEGETADGTKQTIENQPAILMLKGSNFNPFEDEVVKSLPKGASLYDYPIEVSAEENQNGSVIYYVMHFATDFKKKLVLDDATYETMVVMAEMVKSENDMIEASHQKSLREEQSTDDAIDALALELEDE